MGGKASRSKGIRGELNLRDFLIKCGYTDVKRIPLSGAMAGFRGDVIGTLNGKEYIFELKCRARAFGTLYEIAEAAEVITLIDKESVEVAKLCEFPPTNFPDLTVTITDSLAKRLRKMQKDWLKGEDVLVLKDDRRPFMFLEFPKPEKKKKSSRSIKKCRK